MKTPNFFWFYKYIKSLFFSTILITPFATGSFLTYKLSNLTTLNIYLILLIVALVINAIASVTLFVQWRQSRAKVTWLTIFALFPIVGALLFLMFGLRYKERLTLNQRNEAENYRYEIFNDSKNPLMNWQSKTANRGIYRGEFEFKTNAHESFVSLFKDLESAKKFIHIIYYIIKPGEIYNQLKSILKKKISEGVQIRMLLDDFGRWGLPNHELSELRKMGIEIHLINSVHFPFIASQNGYRSHHKMSIIDGEIVHTGGANISDEYVNYSKMYGHWIDYFVKIEGQATNSYSLLFLHLWNKISKSDIGYARWLSQSNTGNTTSVLTEDGPNFRDSIIHNSLIKWISSAKKSIKLATPYFVPTQHIFSALQSAAIGGIDVEIFVPGKKDKWPAHAATKYWCDALQKFGVKIRVGTGIIFHSKIGLIDDEIAYFGTINLDFRSMYSQFEFASLVYGEGTNQIKNIFIEYENYSKTLPEGDWATQKIHEKIIRSIISFLEPVM